MKRRLLALFACAVLFGLAGAAQSQESLHRRTVMGDANGEIIRVFNWWNEPVVADLNAVEFYRFNAYLNAWEIVDIGMYDVLQGAFKLKFPPYRSGVTIEGFVPPNLGGISFEPLQAMESLALFSDNPAGDMDAIVRAVRTSLRRFGLKPAGNPLTVYLCLATEGFDALDLDYQATFPGMRLVAVIPARANGKLDVANISYGDKGTSLLWTLPHFVILVPSS